MRVSSYDIQIGHEQTDGRRYVIETYTCDDGETRIREYLAPSDADHDALAENAARALESTIAAEQDNQEIMQKEGVALARGKVELAADALAAEVELRA